MNRSHTDSQRNREVVLKNGQSLKDVLTMWPKDKQNNPCDALPAGVHLETAPPQLRVLRVQLEDSQMGRPEFVSGTQPASSVYQGAWSLASVKSVCPDDARIVGPPGQILLQVDGGNSVLTGTMTMELAIGDLATLQVDNWRSDGDSPNLAACCKAALGC